MFENSTVPFTIIREKKEDATDNQYTWKKTMLSPDTLNYTIENITLAQEPTETLSLNVTLLRVELKCKGEAQINCGRCGVKSIEQQELMCPFCDNDFPTVESKHSFTDNGNFIAYSLNIDCHNYLHEFSNGYSYEVMCKIPCMEKPNECLFSRTQLRLDKYVEFKKCYASTVEEFNISNLNLYFCIRRIDNQNSKINIPTMLSIVSIFQNSDFDDQKVILQAKDGPVTAYKSVLSHYSDVFRAAFTHEMKEKQEGVVKIADFDSKVIQKMVDYLYTGKLGNVTMMIRDLFKLAHQYQLSELCRRCEEYYMFNFDIDNDHIVDILELADLYDLEKLKNSAEKFVQRYQEDLSKLPSYQKYLCQTISIQKAVNTLIFADQYAIIDVKNCALDFIKLNYKKMGESDDFVKLFKSNPRLMEEVYFHFCKDKK